MEKEIYVWEIKRTSGITFWLVYTILFVILFGVVFSDFIFNGISFINRIDGLDQQYSSLLYFSDWLRTCKEEFLLHGKLVFPMWDPNIGQGADIITTMFYYVIGNPINMLAGIVPYGMLDYLYGLAFVVGLYFAGVAFACFSLYHKNGKTQIILGAMIYCFCGFVLQKGIQHTYFVNFLVFLPLILLGIDRIYDKKKSSVFIIFTALAALSFFYFFYMIFFFILLYAGYRFFAREGSRSIKEACYWLLSFCAYGLIAIMIAAVTFLPSIAQILNSDRISADNYVPYLYDLKYYYKLFFGWMTNEFRDFDTRTGYASIVGPAVVLLFLRKGNKGLKIIFLSLTTFLCIPFMGSALNGFSYVSNRWIFVYSMLVAYIFVKAYPLFFDMEQKTLIKLSGGIAGYCGLSMLFSVWATKEVFQSELFLLLILIGIVIGCLAKSKIGIQAVMCSSVIIGILLLSHNEYSAQGRNAAAVAYIPYSDTYQQYDYSLVSNHLKEISDIDAYRSMCSGYEVELRNSYMLQGLHGTDFYFSITDRHISQYMREMFYNQAMEHAIIGLDNRLIMEMLASVKYYLVHPGDVQPYDFIGKNVNAASKAENNIMIYENPVALPFGYSYDTYISRGQYDKLSVTDKQEVMMYSAVLEEDELPEAADAPFENSYPTLTNREAKYVITEHQGIDIGEGIFDVREANAKLTLNMNEIPYNSECYVIVEGLDYEGISPEGGSYKEPVQVTMQISNGQTNKDITYFTNKHRMYSGKKNFLCNLGQAADVSEISITFSQSGRYSGNNLRVVYQPLDGVIQQAIKLNQTHLEDIEFGINVIRGKVKCENGKILCMSIPYNEGWKAYVDGEKSNYLQINTMYMGLMLEEGDHVIELRYETPYIRTGGRLSIIGILLLVGILFVERRTYVQNISKRRRKGERE